MKSEGFPNLCQPDEADLRSDSEFALERYRYILHQLSVVNENVYRFLALYQTLTTAIVGAALVLFIGYRSWGISASSARVGVTVLMTLVTLVALFAVLLITVGVMAWFDYRTEECDLTDREVSVGFRKRPRAANFVRWYETYIVIFIILSTIFLWFGFGAAVMPNIK